MLAPVCRECPIRLGRRAGKSQALGEPRLYVIQDAARVTNWDEWGCRPLAGYWPPICILLVPGADGAVQPRPELGDA